MEDLQPTQGESLNESTDTSAAAESAPSEGLSAEQQQQLVELDKLEKFKFQGKEWTPKDLLSGFMLQSDYTRKTTEIAQERKFYENLPADLESVRGNPSLASQFKQVYPEKFHSYLRFLEKSGPSQAQGQQADESGSDMKLPPHLQKRLEQLDTVEGYFREQQVKAATAELDSILNPLNEKYPFALEEAALARGDALMKQGVELTKERWDEIYKGLNEMGEKKAKEYYSKQVSKQKTANLKGSDVAAGGGIPSGSPRIPKSIKEAREMALAEINAQQG